MSRQPITGPHNRPDATARLANVHRVVAIAGRRARWNAALRTGVSAAAVAAGALLLLIIAARTTPALGLPPGSALWPWIAGAAAAAVVAAAVIAWLAPRTPIDDAIAVDQRLDLRDRLGSALALAGDDAPFALAAVRDGEQAAADRQLPARVAAAFAIRWPRTWWAAPVLALAALLAAWLLPQLDLWSRSPRAADEAIRQARDEASREIDAIVRRIEENPELAEALAEEIEKAGKEFKVEEHRSPEEIRREALRAMTELSEKLDALLKQEESMALEILRDQLAAMPLPDSPEARKLAEALKRGDFNAANEALREIQAALENGSLTAEDREALAAALEQMAAELAKAEASKAALEEALRQAGLDPQLASNPDALRSAIQNSSNLSESQRQGLMKALQSQESASQMSRQLSQQMSAMASECNGEGSPSGSRGEGLRGALSDLERLQMKLAQAKLAQSACRGGATGLAGLTPGTFPAGGVGGGIGSGGPAGSTGPERHTSVNLRLERAEGMQAGADVVAREFIEGAPLVGESRAVMRRIEVNAGGLAEEAGEEDPIPPHLRDAHKHYFGELKKRIDARSRGDAAP